MSDNLSARATLNGLRLAPRKVSLVAGLVRGRTVEDAIVILGHTPKRAAKPLLKLAYGRTPSIITTSSRRGSGSVPSR